jgi:hypothetical protein
MPAMIRRDGKAKRIAYSILGIPSNMKKRRGGRPKKTVSSFPIAPAQDSLPAPFVRM